MMGLWADGWFYISSAGLLISGILFFFLLGQYRLASEAADATEELAADKEAAVPDSAVRPVYIPDEAPAAKVASHVTEPEPKPTPAPVAAPKTEETPVERRKDSATSTGGISPAVVYLQNIKVELADLHNDLRALSKRVDDELSSVSTRDEALIERLGELTRAVENLKASAASPEADEEPSKPARKPRKAEKSPEAEPKPEPAAEAAKPAEIAIEAPPPAAEPSPAPAAAPAPAISPEETIRMELGAIVAPPAAAAQPQAPAEPAAAEPPPPEAPPAEEKPRRGPVWPV